MVDRDIIELKPITNGLSSDKKYYVELQSGESLLMRVSAIETYKKKKHFFEIVSQVADHGISIPRPIDLKIHDEEVYYFEEWIDGKDLKDEIDTMSFSEQYFYGTKAGSILKAIHSIPTTIDLGDWTSRYNLKIDRRLKKYSECPLKFEYGEQIIKYINANRDIIKDRPQSFQHGDFHIENMMIRNGELVLIDFGRFDYGDPWEEFNRTTWMADKSPYFTSGLLNSYFNGMPPELFWKLLTFYEGCNTLATISWGNFGKSNLTQMLDYAYKFLNDRSYLKTFVPSWFIKDMR